MLSWADLQHLKPNFLVCPFKTSSFVFQDEFLTLSKFTPLRSEAPVCKMSICLHEILNSVGLAEDMFIVQKINNSGACICLVLTLCNLTCDLLIESFHLVPVNCYLQGPELRKDLGTVI